MLISKVDRRHFRGDEIRFPPEISFDEVELENTPWKIRFITH